ncbi:MAG: NAD(P)-dependent oxidoreductase [Candidatus Liptonbacteria bacterium]|nr:NAD(P)-dependent oxidoreductase [Candidatus Liptonbacteria bacterium]
MGDSDKNKDKLVLVTGGAGYVGTVLVDRLLHEGYRVRVLDSLKFGPHGILSFFSRDRFEFMKGDIRNRETVLKAAEGAHYIVHLAAIVGFPACRKDPELSRDINVNGTKHVVEVAAGKIPVFYASTGSNYGKMLEALCTETTPLNPLTDYGRQKTEAEEIIKQNKEFVIFRFATAFGVSPRMRLDLLPNDFTYKAVRERSLIVYEKHFMRTFIHVRDMARAFLFAIDNYDKMKGEIYNVGSNDLNYSKEAICRMILNKVDYYLHFADIGKDLDQRDYLVSYNKLEKLGYHTSVSMEQGIDELIKLSEVIDIQNPHSNV